MTSCMPSIMAWLGSVNMSSSISSVDILVLLLVVTLRVVVLSESIAIYLRVCHMNIFVVNVSKYLYQMQQVRTRYYTDGGVVNGVATIERTYRHAYIHTNILPNLGNT